MTSTDVAMAFPSGSFRVMYTRVDQSSSIRPPTLITAWMASSLSSPMSRQTTLALPGMGPASRRSSEAVTYCLVNPTFPERLLKEPRAFEDLLRYFSPDGQGGERPPRFPRIVIENIDSGVSWHAVGPIILQSVVSHEMMPAKPVYEFDVIVSKGNLNRRSQFSDGHSQNANKRSNQGEESNLQWDYEIAQR